MALTVETGAGLAAADSYLSVADADTYHAAHGTAEASWVDLDTEVKEQCLRRATQYLVQMYRRRWKGVRMTATQALDWPRGYVYTEAFLHGAVGAYPYLVPDDIVPPEVEKACAELALRANTSELAPDVSPAVKSEQVGPIKIEYADGAAASVTYPSVERLIAPLLNDAGGISGTAVRG
jgi:hypothetical protein